MVDSDWSGRASMVWWEDETDVGSSDSLLTCGMSCWLTRIAAEDLFLYPDIKGALIDWKIP